MGVWCVLLPVCPAPACAALTLACATASSCSTTSDAGFADLKDRRGLKQNRGTASGAGGGATASVATSSAAACSDAPASAASASAAPASAAPQRDLAQRSVLPPEPLAATGPQQNSRKRRQTGHRIDTDVLAMASSEQGQLGGAAARGTARQNTRSWLRRRSSHV